MANISPQKEALIALNNRVPDETCLRNVRGLTAYLAVDQDHSRLLGSQAVQPMDGRRLDFSQKLAILFTQVAAEPDGIRYSRYTIGRHEDRLREGESLHAVLVRSASDEEIETYRERHGFSRDVAVKDCLALLKEDTRIPEVAILLREAGIIIPYGSI